MQTPSPSQPSGFIGLDLSTLDPSASGKDDSIAPEHAQPGHFYLAVRVRPPYQAEPEIRFIHVAAYAPALNTLKAALRVAKPSHHERLVALSAAHKAHFHASDALHAGAVELPSASAVSGDGLFTVELYQLGRGITIERERTDLSAREAAFELDTGLGHFLLVDPRLADTAQRSIKTIERDIGSIITQLQAEDEIHQSVWMGDFQNVIHGFGHGAAPKAAIVSLKSGTGKTTLAVELAQRLGLTRVWDMWVPGRHPILPGTLHLTNAPVSFDEVPA